MDSKKYNIGDVYWPDILVMKQCDAINAKKEAKQFLTKHPFLLVEKTDRAGTWLSLTTTPKRFSRPLPEEDIVWINSKQKGPNYIFNPNFPFVVPHDVMDRATEDLLPAALVTPQAIAENWTPRMIPRPASKPVEPAIDSISTKALIAELAARRKKKKNALAQAKIAAQLVAVELGYEVVAITLREI